MFISMGHVWEAVLHHLKRLGAEGGQGLVEYAMLLILVAVAMMALMLILGPGLSNVYSNILANM